jgi:hypothetical protein
MTNFLCLILHFRRMSETKNQRPPAEVARAPSTGLLIPPALLVVADLQLKKQNLLLKWQDI